jgi:hypothetical protein
MNHQWKILDDGTIESIGVMNTEYWIAGNRIAEPRDWGGDSLYEWPLHMSEKTWIDLRAFEEVFRAAFVANGVDMDADKMDRSFAEAFRQLATR